MIKFSEITQEQLEGLKNSKNPKKLFKEIVNLQPRARYDMGDTMIKVDNAKALDVFKNTFHSKDLYYIIIEPVDEKMAFAYSLYPY